MFKRGEVYTLKTGEKVLFKREFEDYFTREKLVVFKTGEKNVVTTKKVFQEYLVTTTEKPDISSQLALFSSFFKGRTEVFADSFQHKESGKMIYYPLCNIRRKANCPKLGNKSFKCSLCKVSQYQAFGDSFLKQHLYGQKLYGIYPLLADNTVYFLALDFDKKNFQQVVERVVQVAKKMGFQPLIERSQSGRGAHIWFFFEEKIPAFLARRLGDLLMKATMLEYPELPFDCFDRMFPSQNEAREDGLGNLIALPLQNERVKLGNSTFVNERFEVVENVWERLENTPKLSQRAVENWVEKLEKELAVSYYSPEKEEQEVSLFEQEEVNAKAIRIIRRNELIVDCKELTKREVWQLRNLATFHNPAFYKAERERRSTDRYPRKISLARVEKQLLYLPRALEEKIRQLFPNAIFKDERTGGKTIKTRFLGELYPGQTVALAHMMQKENGILQADTGFGKTVLAAKLIAEKGVSTLIFAHTQTLAKQWKERLETFLAIEDAPFEERTAKGRLRKKGKIGELYGGKKLRSSIIDIATFQTFANLEKAEEIFADYGMILVDECHHLSAFTFEEVIKKAAVKYLYGLTATPRRTDGLENILFLRIGNIRYQAKKEIPVHIEKKLFLKFTNVGEWSRNLGTTIHEQYDCLINSKERQVQLVQDMKQAIAQGRHILVLSKYVKQLYKLEEDLRKEGVTQPIYVLTSKKKAKAIQEDLLKVKAETKPFFLLTTGNFAGEGFDLPILDTLFLAMPISSETSMQQYLGRLLRDLEKKKELHVYDYVDYAVPAFWRMYQKRLYSYKKLGYHVVEESGSAFYQSNLHEKYEAILLQECLCAKKTITLILPGLSKKWVRDFTQGQLGEEVRKRLILPTSAREKCRSEWSALAQMGFEVLFRAHFYQRFVLLDDAVVWFLPEKERDGDENVALRLVSQEFSKRVSERFMAGLKGK